MKKRAKRVLIYGAALILLFAVGFHFYFIRDPEIAIPGGENDILSPASGRIIKIDEINSSKLEKISIEKGIAGKVNTEITDVCNDSCMIITIFMTLLDVHVQRASLSGKVLSTSHKPGALLPTTKFESTFTNEKTEIIIENEKIGKFKIIQVAGFIVRRIKTFVNEGDEAERGQRIGLIKYSSQVSIILPKEKIVVLAEEGGHIEAGSSIIARIRE